MAFSKIDLDSIKSKLTLSKEFEKKTKLLKKGKDYWCCCLFHEEKTPSCKINDDLGSYYCFGCGAKGDIFSLYTDLYNYSFLDAVTELSQGLGIKLNTDENIKNSTNDKVYKILELTARWYEDNLKSFKGNLCEKYLVKRNLNKDTIQTFRLGYSYNPKTTLYDYLKKNNFKDEDLLKSNVIKVDSNKKFKDFFYKRLMFPITNLQGKVVGFGGRVIDDSNPKYINSPESSFFQKRYLLYNLVSAKNFARKKKNLLICEGYMDVISLYQHGIQSIVAPLGTAFTEAQLNLAWRFSEKPTIMFDSDTAGLRAAYKAALMSLPLLAPKKFLQFVVLPNGLDPDNFLNNYSFKELVKILKAPISLIQFIFNESAKSLKIENADDKIIFDKYLDDVVETIKDKKIKYFYKNELKSLFFDKLKKTNQKKVNFSFSKTNSLLEKEILAYFAALLIHSNEREEIIEALKDARFLEENHKKLFEYIRNNDFSNSPMDKIIENCEVKEFKEMLSKSLENQISQLFPFASPKYDSKKAKIDIKDSVKNLNTRLLNLKKINKSLDTFVSEANSLNWEELQKIKEEIQSGQEKE